MPELTITLPLPDRALSPNAPGSVHWGTKRRKVAKARGDAKLATMAAMNGIRLRRPLEQPTVLLTYHFRVKRRRDDDNLIGWAKAYHDGCGDAGLWVDDSEVTWLPPRQAVDRANPRLEMRVSGL